MINGDRIRHARELRGWTQTELAERLDVTQAAVAYFEQGSRVPLDDVAQRMALVLGFLPSFFRRPPVVDFPEGSLLYRTQGHITEREKAQVRRYGASYYEILTELERRIKPRHLRIPRQQGDPTQAANMARATMGLAPDRPIPNVMRAIERAGVWVMAIPPEFRKNVESFSVWVAGETDVPLIGIGQGMPSDRQRFTLAFELGHLVLHSAAAGTPKALEQEAYLFASEFLMPESSIREDLVAPITLSMLGPLKAKWGVSLGALIRRALNLGIISPRQNTHLNKQMNVRGWSKDEPLSNGIPVELPRGLRRVAELIYGEPLDYSRMVSDLAELGYAAPFIKELLESHAFRAGDHVVRQESQEQGTVLLFPEDRSRIRLREG